MGNIVLCGYQASGKTVIGEELARLMSRKFIDTDLLVEEKHGKGANCREIYRRHGESYFRELEQQVIATMDCTDAVIALGGGTLVSMVNWESVKKLGCVVYLKVPVAKIRERMLEHGIPSFLQGSNFRESFDAMIKSREKKYVDIANVCFEVENLDPKSAALQMMNLVGEYHG